VEYVVCIFLSGNGVPTAATPAYVSTYNPSDPGIAGLAVPHFTSKLCGLTTHCVTAAGA